MVIRFRGRTISKVWMNDEQRSRLSNDQINRIQTVAMALHSNICHLFLQMLRHWAAGLRQQLLDLLRGQTDWHVVCRTIASWCSAETVSIFRVDQDKLHPFQSSISPTWAKEARYTPKEGYLPPPNELRMFTHPLFLPTEEISLHGFLAWNPRTQDVDPDRKAIRNVGTIPMIASPHRTQAILRVDNALALFGAHVQPESKQEALYHFKPGSTPMHLRSVLEEIAGILAPALEMPLEDSIDWKNWVVMARDGRIDTAEIEATLDRVYAELPTIAAASKQFDINRETFRKNLLQLNRVISVPWRWWKGVE